MHLNLLTLFLSPLALALPNNHLTTTKMNNHPKLLSTNTTLGHATVHNLCPQPIYLWTVGSTISPQFTLQSNTTYTERYRRDPSSGGIALKLTRVPNGLYASAPQMIFAYNLVGGQIWYDLSDVFGDPFVGEPVRVEYEVEGGRGGDKGDREGIEWVHGVPTGGSMVRVAEAQGDIVLTVC
jgi:hypothetical protein